MKIKKKNRKYEREKMAKIQKKKVEKRIRLHQKKD